MADHLDEGLAPPAGDVRIDITDVYAFHPPGDSGRRLGKVVLAMGVNPLSLARTFRPDARYEFVIDTNGDAMEDIVFRLTFSKPNKKGIQRVKLRQTLGGGRRHDDDDDEDDDDDDEDDDDERVSGRGKTEDIIPLEDGGKLFAGVRDDPFFFDLVAFLNGLSFCNPPNGDFFAGKNVSAIVMELPRKALGPSRQIGVWGRTLIPENGAWTQVERMGRPAINTVFMPKTLKRQFNRGQPKDDRAQYRDIVKGVLKALGGYDDTTAGAIADILLPDILTFDTSKTSGFLNGRNLEDDVIDAELKIVTNNPAAGDCVDANDKAFLNKFPYYATPHPF